MQNRQIARLILSLTCLSLLLTTVVMARADGALVVEENECQGHLGKSLQFRLKVSGPSEISSIILTYRTADNQGMTIEQMDFSPNSLVELTYDLDVARHPLKPFVEIEYWWTIRDATDQPFTTEHRPCTYEDDRFTWDTLTGQHVAVHWYDRDIAFGSQALGVADMAVDRITEMIDPALALAGPFHLYLYASEPDLLPALPATGREWVAGQAYPELQLAVVAIPSGPESASTMRRLIPHELTHLLLYEAMGSNYRRLPSWLNEGLAVISEQPPDPDDALVINRAFQDGELLSLDTLCYSFPYQDDLVRLAYAQSASIVRFIQENYGYSAIGGLMAAYGDGLSCGRGVRRALGISLGSLESEWRESLGTHPRSSILLKQAAPWLLLMLTSLPLFLLVVQPLLAHRRKQKHERVL